MLISEIENTKVIMDYELDEVFKSKTSEQNCYDDYIVAKEIIKHFKRLGKQKNCKSTNQYVYRKSELMYILNALQKENLIHEISYKEVDDDGFKYYVVNFKEILEGRY